MRKLLVFLALCGALPITILAQDNSANSPQPKPADTQDKSTPALEKPGMAPATPETSPAPAKKTPPPAAKVDPNSGHVVEEIIARVNNEIITRSEYDKARATAAEDAKQDCQNHCTPEQLEIAIEDRQKNTLRDLIDQSLLVQRGKDMGIAVEPEVIKRLDQIRLQNKLESMEDLEKAVTSQGTNWEDFKNNIRNGLLTQRVIGNEEIQKYYEEHKAQFVRPEQVALREIEVSTQGKKESELPDLKKKAETALKRVQDGEDFGEIAKRLSDGSTAKQGGFLGVYKRGELAKELEDKVFTMKKNGLTDIMDTKQGYLILQVLEHYDEGEQPLSKVENEITEHIYNQR